MTPAQAFEAHVLPCLDAGYNLARWLMRDEAAAEDALQDAALRAFRYLDMARTDEVRPWFLKIVRNTCYTHLERQRDMRELSGLEDDELEQMQVSAGGVAPDPVALLSQRRDRERIDAAIRALSPPLREVIVLREMEGLDYARIGEIASIPIGTVMSRLSRARARLREVLAALDADAGQVTQRGSQDE